MTDEAKYQAFLDDIKAVCEKHQMGICGRSTTDDIFGEISIETTKSISYYMESPAHHCDGQLRFGGDDVYFKGILPDSLKG